MQTYQLYSGINLYIILKFAPRLTKIQPENIVSTCTFTLENGSQCKHPRVAANFRPGFMGSNPKPVSKYFLQYPMQLLEFHSISSPLSQELENVQSSYPITTNQAAEKFYYTPTSYCRYPPELRSA